MTSHHNFLRSTSRFLQSIVNPILFQHIYISFRIEDIDGLELLTASSAKHIRELTINPEVLPVLTKEEWEANVCKSLCETAQSPVPRDMRQRAFLLGNPNSLEADEVRQLMGENYSPQRLKDGWERFTTAMYSQQIWHYCEPQQRLKRAFKTLKNLETVNLDSEPTWSDGKLHRPGLINDPKGSCSPYRLTLLDSMCCADLVYGLPNFDDDDTESGFVEGPRTDFSARAICRVVEALVERQSIEHNKPVIIGRFGVAHYVLFREVFARSQSLPDVTEDEVALNLDKGDVSRLLTQLKIVQIDLSLTESRRELFLHKEILLGLAQARNLVSLDFDVGIGPEINNETFGGFLVEYYSRSPWHNLEHIGFSGAINAPNLFRLVSMNANSLRSLHLHDIRLMPAARWDDLLRKLQPLLKFKQAEVHLLSITGPARNDTTFLGGVSVKKSDEQRRVWNNSW